MEQLKTTPVKNAGIVLMAPFLPRLFQYLNLLENHNKFVDKDAQIKAVFLMLYAAEEKTESPENTLFLNKMMAGINEAEKIPQTMRLSLVEIKTVNDMLSSAKQHWEKMKTTSLIALRESFLQRDGILEDKEEYCELKIGDKAYDMLLDSVPWNFRMIKFPWMKKRLLVNWREEKGN